MTQALVILLAGKCAYTIVTDSVTCTNWRVTGYVAVAIQTHVCFRWAVLFAVASWKYMINDNLVGGFWRKTFQATKQFSLFQSSSHAVANTVFTQSCFTTWNNEVNDPFSKCVMKNTQHTSVVSILRGYLLMRTTMNDQKKWVRTYQQVELDRQPPHTILDRHCTDNFDRYILCF